MKMIRCFYLKKDEWKEATLKLEEKQQVFEAENGKIRAKLIQEPFGWDYEMEANVEFDTRIHLELSLDGTEDAYHVIPCTIYGDNNVDQVKKGELPALTRKNEGVRFCSPYWELRADRAAVPVSMMYVEGIGAGVSVDPYTEAERGRVHNGIYAKLPRTIGVSMGYCNYPVTFIDKGKAGDRTWENIRCAKTGGRIYLLRGKGREILHQIVRREYELRHERALYHKNITEAAKAIVNACVKMNWNEKWQAYTDMSCCPPENKELKAWRPVYEIGWTGIAELAGPFIMAEKLLGLPKGVWGKAKNGWQLFDQIVGAYNERSGLLNDLVRPIDESGSLVNGWWQYYGIARECHCAYNNGKAVYEMLKIMDFLSTRGEQFPDTWLEVSCSVLDTIRELQREDGNFGYTYSCTEKKVLDWDGFAGCWFVPAMVYAYRLTGRLEYLKAAEKAEVFYSGWVYDLNCYGTPMDTWKAVDEEGNLAFVRGARLLHEVTEEKKYLEYLEAGANYEYLWRYAYRTEPEYKPLNDGWNACGGSVTSISNPHIHPMGVLIDDDLRYLSKQTQDNYHEMRAADGTAWVMQNLELYPEKSEYGYYGITSERFCPSDGLVTERYSDGQPYSSWFTFNLWATANVLEALLDYIKS